MVIIPINTFRIFNLTRLGIQDRQTNDRMTSPPCSIIRTIPEARRAFNVESLNFLLLMRSGPFALQSQCPTSLNKPCIITE